MIPSLINVSQRFVMIFFWPLAASAASCGAPSPDLRAAVVPSPPPCAAPVYAAPTLAAAPVSPPTAGPCMVSHSYTHTNPPCSVSNVEHIRSESQRGFLVLVIPFMAEQQFPVQVLVARCLYWGTVQFPGLKDLVTAAVCCGLTGQPLAANRTLWGTQNNSYHYLLTLTFNFSDLNSNSDQIFKLINE